MDAFTYNVPFYDFSEGGRENENFLEHEAFFETEHANHNGTYNYTDSPEVEQQFYTPLKMFSGDAKETDKDDSHFVLRKSLSTSNLPDDTKLAQKHMEVKVEEISVSMKTLEVASNKMNRSYASDDLNVLRPRSISKERLNQLAQPKWKATPRQQVQNKKYITMAEAVSKFHQQTPIRFRTKSKLRDVPLVQRGPLHITIAQSPNFATKQRIRPVHTVSTEELQQEEAKKFAIKARPLNPRILKGPVALNAIEKKPNTVPQPFNLTKIERKIESPKPFSNSFHAKPVPKSVLQPKPVIKPALQPLVTIPKPFSFEGKDRDLMKKRQQSFMSASKENVFNRTGLGLAANRKRQTLFDSTSFQLNTERRAKEREEFENKLRQKEMANLEYRRTREEELLRQEMEREARLRKEAEFKAHEIRRYKEVEKVSPRDLTVPLQPKFVSDEVLEKRKH